MEKFLAITADDYGPHPYINKGILDGINKGVVDSVGVMVNSYQTEDGKYKYDLTQEIQNLVESIGDKQVGIGLHLSISAGSPITNSKFLYLENNKFQHIKSFDFGTGFNHLQAINAEIEAQILTLQSQLNKYNKVIDHISSHQGLISLFSPYNKELVNVLLKHNIKTAIRNPLPVSKQKYLKKRFNNSLMKKEGVNRAFRLVDDNLNHVGKLLKGIKRKELIKKGNAFKDIGCHVPNHFFENYYGKPSISELNKVFKNFHKSIFRNYGEFVVHLGKGNESSMELHGINHHYFKKRNTELETLSQFDFSILDNSQVFRLPMGGEVIPFEPLIA